MADVQKYNLREKLEDADKRLTGSPSLLGKSMLTLPQYDNSMRTVMNTSHQNQFLTLLNPEFPGFFMNTENLVGKYSDGYKKIKHDSTVFRKVVKYEGIVDKPSIFELFIYDEQKERYDVITREDVEDLTEVFGYEYINDVIDGLDEGDFIPKNTVLYKSTSYDDVMNYGYGKNISIMYTTDPYTSEDAAVVSKSLAKSMESLEVETIEININDNDYPLNIYGNKKEYKVIPDIGERSDGILCAVRRLYNNQLLYDFKDSSLATVYDSDSKYYHDGEVVDIIIHCNADEIEESSFNSQLLKYLNGQNAYYEEIIEVCEEIMTSGKKYTAMIDRLYKRAKEFLDTESKWRDGDSTFSYLHVEIVMKKRVGLYKGQKFTG